jgi:hypothetical protein
VIEGGIERGEFKSVDPRVAATVVTARSTSCSPAWVLDRLPSGEEDVAAAEQTLVKVSLRGLEK